MRSRAQTGRHRRTPLGGISGSTTPCEAGGCGTTDALGKPSSPHAKQLEAQPHHPCGDGDGPKSAPLTRTMRAKITGETSRDLGHQSTSKTIFREEQCNLDLLTPVGVNDEAKGDQGWRQRDSAHNQLKDIGMEGGRQGGRDGEKE